MKTRRGFTLVEMLTVIVIILILAGITMKLMALVNQKTARARAAGDLERMKNAITEYYAVNGCYPPVDRIDREFADPIYGPKAAPKDGYGYFDGLTAYLFTYEKGDYTGPWAKYVQGWAWGGSHAAHEGDNPLSGTLLWSNRYHTIRDPWGRSYVYESGPPYQSFLLMSKGPDGKQGTVDDMGGKWAE